MSTSEAGFSLVEALVGLLVAMMLILATAPMWVGLETRGAAWNDRVVVLLQTRVAAARLERDLRLIGVDACPGLQGSAVLEVSATSIVVVTSAAEGTPEIVKWEFTRGSLMRRRLPWPGYLPVSFGAGTFTDHKTMLEGVEPGAQFTFYQGSAEATPPLSAEARAHVDRVVVTATVATDSGTEVPSSAVPGEVGAVSVAWVAEVGR